MLQSHLFSQTRREAPAGETSKNAILLYRAGFIHKTMAGVMSYTPLGLKVLQKISGIVRQEMNALPHVQEVLLPALHPRELWEESGRWAEAIGDVMYTVAEETAALGPTHEEVMTDLVRAHLHSYKQLPVALYQIQTKFRKELRAKSGLLRGREFLMKDLYSFHLSEEDFDNFYGQVSDAYLRIYNRCGLDALLTKASGGMFAKFSDEFQVIAEAGEDTIYLRADGREARNQEIVEDASSAELGEYCGGEVKTASAIEVGNIFRLGKKFSEPMHAVVQTEDGGEQALWMGCYGIGISRVMGTVVEVYGDVEKGAMVWPKEIAPFAVHLIDLTQDKQGVAVYEALKASGVEVLFDDREASTGAKMADADLLGIPTRIIIGKRSLEQGGAEVIDRSTGESKIVALTDLTKTV